MYKVVAGIGSRRGVSRQEVEQALGRALELSGLCRSSLCRLASIELKREEIAFHEVASQLEIPIDFYKKEELAEVRSPSSSCFVKEKVGVDSVCESAAILATGKGKLILPKTKFGRVTVALAKAESP
jgi:cobalt-precorrin 5A hydrolase